jgi:hypothetical protein
MPSGGNWKRFAEGGFMVALLYKPLDMPDFLFFCVLAGQR